MSTGTRVRPAWRRWRHSDKPSRFGSIRSRTVAGRPAPSAICRPASPSSTCSTLSPRASKSSAMFAAMSRWSSISNKRMGGGRKFDTEASHSTGSVRAAGQKREPSLDLCRKSMNHVNVTRLSNLSSMPRARCRAMEDCEASMATARMTGLFRRADAFEHAWCVRLNRSCQQRAIRQFFASVSWLGDGVFWYTLILLLPVVYGERGLYPAVRMAVVGFVGLALYKYLKTRLV